MRGAIKTVILFIFLLRCTLSFSQNDNALSSRIVDGNLSEKECVSLLNKNRLEEAVPSLTTLMRKYEQDNNYDGERLFSWFQTLYYYYLNKGDYATTRQLINEIGVVFNSHEKEPNNKFIRLLLCFRGKLSLSLKNYEEALQYLKLSKNYYEEKNDCGESYIIVLCNIALCYQSMEDLLSSKIYMDEAMEMLEKTHGSIYNLQKDDLLPFIFNYASLCHAIGHDSDAEKYFWIVINSKQGTPLSVDAHNMACNNLAVMYMEQGKWEKGLRLLESIRSEYGEYDFYFKQNLALCQLYLHNNDKAIASLRDMNNRAANNLANVISRLTTLERENYLTDITFALVAVNNLIASRINNPEATKVAYDNILFCRNMQINISSILSRLISQSKNDEILQKNREYNSLRHQLSFKSNNGNQRDSLVRLANDIESELLSKIDNFGDKLKSQTHTWKDVQTSLDGDEAAIEFCYVPKMQYLRDVKPYYAAFVLRKDFDSPIFVPLENMDSIISVYRSSNGDQLAINEMYSSNKVMKFYKMLWSKITPHLRGIKKVYYSPTGYLSNINFEVLMDDKSKRLNDKYMMVRVSSTGNIADVKSQSINPVKTAALYGNINYNEGFKDMADASSVYPLYTGSQIMLELASRSENDRGNWDNIKYTKDEIDSIYSILSKDSVKVSLFEGNTANEESFKNLSGHSPNILHLSTHGFVIGTQQQASENKFIASTYGYSRKNAYMLWAGLVLAGGNNTWNGNFNLKNVEDGILTAEEISRLDLSNTKLAVLSACETAKGVVDPVDGVYGLQRAFKIAGVKTIVMSLWKVNDVATSMLMTHFYKYLTDRIERHKALWKAMMDVKNKYSDPYYWAGFVMLD